MKKIGITLLSILFLVAATGTAFARNNRYVYPRSSHGHHGHGYHRGSADAFWAVLGVSILTGCLISYIVNTPSSQTVVYSSSEPMVAPPPSRVVVKEYSYSPALQSATVDRVVVTAPELNVRTGPGFNHSIAGYVVRGEGLQVLGRAPGWFYVRTASGQHGWVMIDFTVPQAYPLG